MVGKVSVNSFCQQGGLLALGVNRTLYLIIYAIFAIFSWFINPEIFHFL